MANGTHMKQMKLQLQQVTATVMDVQARVGSIKDSIEVVADRRMEEASDRLRGDMHNQIRDEMREQSNMLRDCMQQFMLMFWSQAQIRMSPDFPPRERSEPILS